MMGILKKLFGSGSKPDDTALKAADSRATALEAEKEALYQTLRTLRLRSKAQIEELEEHLEEERAIKRKLDASVSSLTNSLTKTRSSLLFAQEAEKELLDTVEELKISNRVFKELAAERLSHIEKIRNKNHIEIEYK
jgi:DNA repair exonuclease SbcCD ATPase subunit